jgi:hypothetical protein
MKREHHRRAPSPKTLSRPASRPGATRTPARAERPDDEVELLAAFVRECRSAQPERTLNVLEIALDGVRSKRELVEAGWVSLAAAKVRDAWVRGVGPKTVFNTLTRFVTWLHRRGELDRWQRDRLQHAIDEARYAHFVIAERPGPKGMERLEIEPVDRLAERFAETLSHPLERELAPSAVRVLAGHLDAQLGPGRGLPFGALDVDALGAFMLEDVEGDLDAACCLLAIAAAFYRWLGAEGRLDPERAAEQASALAKLAMGTQKAFTC